MVERAQPTLAPGAWVCVCLHPPAGEQCQALIVEGAVCNVCMDGWVGVGEMHGALRRRHEGGSGTCGGTARHQQQGAPCTLGQLPCPVTVLGFVDLGQACPASTHRG